MNKGTLQAGGELATKIEYFEHHIRKVEADQVKIFADQPEIDYAGRPFHIHFNEFLPSPAQAKAQYLKNLREELKKLKIEFQAL